MNADYHNSLLKDSQASALAKTCKEVAAEHVYSAPQTLKLELMGRKIIWDLLDLYWEAGQLIGTDEKEWPTFGKKAYDLISRNYREVCKDHYISSLMLGCDLCWVVGDWDSLRGLASPMAQHKHFAWADGRIGGHLKNTSRNL
jgi:dGTPase